MTQTRIVIIGAGYAGLSAAKRLAGHAAVTVVNPRDEFVERIRLHQLVAGGDDATLPLTSLLVPGTAFVQATAETIDAAGRRVALSTGEEIGYDHLIYAAGSRSAEDAVPGAREHAVTVGDLDGARAARRRSRSRSAGRRSATASTRAGAGSGSAGRSDGDPLSGRGEWS
ncbi:FAD-dependent oxidoreductase [Spirillospora sp. NPDC047279]|uniref:FAD-dependent oxidoreductase n=1 Tax=Spirillospora sp. NPDC047279 TaxID=3155478 RepID=UPI00340F20DD